MKKIYKKYFHVSEDENMVERVFMTRIVTSILSIVLCVIALCSITFAWFTDSVTSSANNITSGTFKVRVEQNGTKLDTNMSVSDVQPSQYTITGEGNVRGYCEIKIGVTKSSSYYTETLEAGDSITLTIAAPDGHYITFMGHWGEPNVSEETKRYGEGDTITVPGYEASEPTPTIDPTPEPTLTIEPTPEPTPTEVPATTPPPMGAPTEGTSTTDEDDTDTSGAQDTQEPVSEG